MQSYLTAKERSACKRGGVHIQTFAVLLAHRAGARQNLGRDAESYQSIKSVSFSRKTGARMDFHNAVGNFMWPKRSLIVLAIAMIEPHYTNDNNNQKQYKP